MKIVKYRGRSSYFYNVVDGDTITETGYANLRKLINSDLVFMPLNLIPQEKVKTILESPVILELNSLDDLKTLMETHPELFL